MSRSPWLRLRRSTVGLVAVAGLTALAACGSGAGPSSTSGAPATSAAPGAGGTLIVFAAASLKATFTELGETFEEQNPGTTVTFNFAGSSDLATQIASGAPADVFASADENNMSKAVTAGLVAGSPVNFASNILTIVTPPGNPKGIRGFADLADPDGQVVVCAPQVPCGAAAQKV